MGSRNTLKIELGASSRCPASTLTTRIESEDRRLQVVDVEGYLLKKIIHDAEMDRLKHASASRPVAKIDVHREAAETIAKLVVYWQNQRRSQRELKPSSAIKPGDIIMVLSPNPDGSLTEIHRGVLERPFIRM